MRLVVKKTYKLYIDGQFPRTESGRHYAIMNTQGDAVLANVCRGSRKDVRNAVVAARKAQDGWAKRTTLNRGQILYRVAEFLEARADQFVGELQSMGSSAKEAREEVEAAVDTWLYYAGWADKYAQVLGTVNPVAGPYYNFSLPEPTGVVGVIAPETPALLGLVAKVAAAMVSGNTVVALTSEARPLCGITLGEVLATSDVPGGVVNIISVHKKELAPWLCSHMDVNAVDLGGIEDKALLPKLHEAAAENVKRVIKGRPTAERSLWALADFLETKTVWHPMAV